MIEVLVRQHDMSHLAIGDVPDIRLDRDGLFECRTGVDEQRPYTEPVADWSGKVEEPALQTELRTVLTTAINDLPTDYRTAFLMHDVEGLSNPEIAETLHISLPAVKSRVHRSRLFLRERLARYLEAA